MRTLSLALLGSGTLLLPALTLAQTTPYYLTDGDASTMYVIQGGVLQATVPTFNLAYPPAIRNTVWLDHRDDAFAVEYNLAGVPTGNTSVGNNAYSQLLDGTSDGQSFNYGVECCGSTDSVIRANADWSGSTTLFNLPTAATGVAYDTSSGTLFVSFFSGGIAEYSLAGSVLNSFAVPDVGILVGLAYEELTDTLWGFDRSGNDLVQFSEAGAFIQRLDIPGFSPFNPFGGEMPLAGGGQPVPEASTVGAALVTLAAIGLGLYRRRR